MWEAKLAPKKVLPVMEALLPLIARARMAIAGVAMHDIS